MEPPEPLDLPDVELPIDDSDGGCDTGDCQLPRPDTRRSPWRRQHAAIEIAEEDVISEDGAEVYSMLRGAGVDTLFFTGVHVNMCVLNRPFGIKQMARWGVDCVLVRDLTDSMYNPGPRRRLRQPRRGNAAGGGARREALVPDDDQRRARHTTERMTGC